MSSVNAQDFPTRPIRMIVPFNPGASVDTIARYMAQLMAKRLNQPIVVENKPGANAAIAAQAVANAPADGYTLFFASDSALVLNGLLYKKLGYNADRDFAAVALAANVPLVLLVNASLPVNNLQEFIAYGKAHPGKLNYSSTGTGGAFHLAGEMFAQGTGIDMTHVPYTGGAPAIQALLGGQVQVMFGIVGSSLPYVKSGKLKALALVTKEPVNVLPNVPTLKDVGYPGLEAMVRYGMVARKSTPPEVLAVLNDAANYALSDPGYKERFLGEAYLVPAPHKPSQFDQILAEDKGRWSAVIKAKNITLE
ncbi:tripartite tricarboxylate transporter substrate binding protein [Variovorax sp. J22R115]|uniref:Bug family tripartite tricarboxylate transporter substrate binding protein n=1 Tax=Variovorax sp. J22R115 TaxID=3053509 RepID=UPI0025774D20|nr:tripartite tricarboxylate transporter substrate binding protein [Variovorax sp. J22R115]MDM0053568.1 tripartite tricarboxylate transporter substrate binding protein [Variovorax sp. J22R115]